MAPDHDEIEKATRSLSLLRHSARVSPLLLDAVADVEAGMERLRDLAGQHDPTGADHMEEMWEHAQRADGLRWAIERALDQLQSGKHYDAEETLQSALSDRSEQP